MSLFRRKPCTNCADARDAVYASLETISGLKREVADLKVRLFAKQMREQVFAQLMDLSQRNPPKKGASRIDEMCALLQSNPRVREIFENYCAIEANGYS